MLYLVTFDINPIKFTETVSEMKEYLRVRIFKVPHINESNEMSLD
jgi:hypothetical protein